MIDMAIKDTSGIIIQESLDEIIPQLERMGATNILVSGMPNDMTISFALHGVGIGIDGYEYGCQIVAERIEGDTDYAMNLRHITNLLLWLNVCIGDGTLSKAAASRLFVPDTRGTMVYQAA